MDEWVCAACGTQNAASLHQCLGCNTHRPLPTLVLSADNGGPVLRTTQRLWVGRALLAQFGDDARYAAEPQFELVPDINAGGWRVLPTHAARNHTCYGGVPLNPGGVILDDGGVIELGPGKLHLRVRLERT
ncbi:MAG: hypothetical protein ACRC8S_12140 [Fimbriiglobus sp.]